MKSAAPGMLLLACAALTVLVQDYVTSFEAAAALATLPREEAAAFVHLNLAVYEVWKGLPS